MSKQDLILLYGGRSAEREVSVLSAESVMRAIDYQAFSVQTYFITQSGDSSRRKRLKRNQRMMRN